jgi:hypothetical protein
MPLLPLSALLLAACTDSDIPGEDTGPFDTGEDCEEGSWFADADGDGFGDANSETLSCEQPSGTVEDSSDCDDASEAVFPGAEEVCGDGLVNDCEGSVAEAMAICPSSWDLETAPRYRSGVQRSGWSLAMDQDVDGDGLDELLLGAPELNGDAKGQVLLYGGDRELALINGSTANAQFGSAVELVDSDGDGLAEVLVGAPMTWGEGSGAAYLFSEPAGVLDDTQADTVLLGESDDAFGAALAHGDLDGDGVEDLLVGARYWQDGEAAIGRSYLFLGPLEAKHSTGDGDYDAAIDGSGGSYREFGGAVAMGDVDGDGVHDVLVGEIYGVDGSGESQRGRAYVFLGGALGTAQAEDADAVLFGSSSYEQFGGALATADVDGDGDQDLLVGSRYAQTLDNGGFGGRVTVFTSPEDRQTAAEADTTLTGELYSQASAGLASAGDVDLDGKEDLLVGAPTDTSGESVGVGSAYLVLGGLTGTHALEEVAVEKVSEEGTALGASVASGDIDGDGAMDAGVGAPLTTHLGEVYVFFGGAF